MNINLEKVIEIYNIAVETDSLLVANKVCFKVQKLDKDHGRVMVNGKYYKWWSLALARRKYNEKS